MNILLLGYGKMGKAIEQFAIERGNQVIQAVNDHTEVTCDLSNVDVAIEFSAPRAAYDNISFALKKGLPVISGTTGWLEHLADVEKIVDEEDGTFFYASNFSLGVNLLFRLNKELARMLGKFEYRPEIEETHHVHKLDAPSGTAITLAEGILENQNHLTNWTPDYSDKVNELPVISIREGEVPGTHSITYRGKHDEISLEHKAYSRAGFALGAVQVAEWIVGKKGMLTMEDFLKD